MTDEEVIAEVERRGGPAAAAMLQMRYQPDGGAADDKVHYQGIMLPDGNCLGVAWSFGKPSADEMSNWKCRWHAVHGPMSRAELEALVRAGR